MTSAIAGVCIWKEIARPERLSMLTNTMISLLGAEYSASRFFKDARAATEDVLARNRVPIVVGGTCTYLRWYGHHRQALFTGARACINKILPESFDRNHCVRLDWGARRGNTESLAGT